MPFEEPAYAQKRVSDEFRQRWIFIKRLCENYKSALCFDNRKDLRFSFLVFNPSFFLILYL